MPANSVAEPLAPSAVARERAGIDALLIRGEHLDGTAAAAAAVAEVTAAAAAALGVEVGAQLDGAACLEHDAAAGTAARTGEAGVLIGTTGIAVGQARPWRVVLGAVEHRVEDLDLAACGSASAPSPSWSQRNV